MKLLSKLTYFTVLLIILMCSACSEDDPSSPNEQKPTEENYTFSSEGKYTLNVIYFLPADVPDRAESHRRLSEILLHGQAFVKKYMNEYGFGDKTYKLMVDKEKKRVKIIYLKAKNPTKYYPYEGGGTKVIEEVEAYFNANPAEKKSPHTLIVTPVKDHDNPDVPFYGMGKYCFALDFDLMDVKYFGENTKRGNDATKYIGGLLHELGHGLNLPHNKEKYSDVTNIQRGTALMGAGNYTYGSKPTFLTEASCAILNNCQVIGDFSGSFYENVKFNLKSIQANYEGGSLKLSGDFETDSKVNYVCFFNDPATDNADYDAVSWASAVKAGNRFEISMPMSELHQKGDTPYVLRLVFCHENGALTSKSFYYKLNNGVPVIEFGDKNYLSRTNWSVIDFSSQEEGGEGQTGRAKDILDGDPASYWHSRWTGTAASHPHHLTVDMSVVTEVAGFSFQQRDGARKVKDIEIYKSNDKTSWEKLGDYQLKNINTVHHLLLNEKSGFRYFKIVIRSAHDGEQFASLAEVMCF